MDEKINNMVELNVARSDGKHLHINTDDARFISLISSEIENWIKEPDERLKLKMEAELQSMMMMAAANV